MRFLLLIVVCVVMVAVPAAADTRTENIDLSLVLDKSLSMEEEIASVRDYVISDILRDLLIPGDFFRLIVFYGEAEEQYSTVVANEADRQRIIEGVSTIEADGHWTDIGNALDLLKQKIPQDPGRRKYLLLITDGQQEAPPESPYYSEDGSFNHQFLENTRTIQKEGWKIMVLGIGSDTAAEELAQRLSGAYTEVNEEATQEDIRQATGDLLAEISLSGDAVLRKNREGWVLVIPVKSSYQSDETVRLKGASGNGVDLGISGSGAFPVPASAESTLRIPLSPENMPEDLPKSMEVTLTFTGDRVITPAVFQVDVRPGGFPVIPVVIGGIVLLAALVAGLILSRFTRGGGVSPILLIQATLEDATVTNKEFRLKDGDGVFIIKGIHGLTLSLQKTAGALARFYARGGELLMDVLDAKGFPVSKPDGDILGKRFRIPRPNGTDAILKVERK